MSNSSPALGDPAAASIEFISVAKAFTRGQNVLPVLDDVSLTIEAGSFVCIVGPSGCGKTTLLRVANRIVKPDRGMVRVGESESYVPGRDIAMVYQNYGLFPWQTVERNVALGLRLRREKNASAKIRPDLERVGLADFATFYPHELSGGMQQRVGIARALALRPRVLLMDEPFAAVDALTREQLQQMLLSIWQSDRMTVIFVTHDIGEAVHLADRIIVMGRGGRIAADFLVTTPRPRTAESRTSAGFIEAERIARRTLAND